MNDHHPSNHHPSNHDPESTCWIDDAAVDLGRRSRCGFGEAIYGEGKTKDLISRIIETQISRGQESLVTRIDPSDAESVGGSFTHWRANHEARTLRVSANAVSPPRRPTADEIHVAVVTAGSTDAGIAAEAIETLAWMNIAVESYSDIGVAGPQRLMSAVPSLRKASALVVVAGMEGALPSVVAGHVAAPIFAVPTSVGYGANLGGITALLGMLTSCAAGVAVVNIDAGFKGAYMAGLMTSRLVDVKQSQSEI